MAIAPPMRIQSLVKSEGSAPTTDGAEAVVRLQRTSTAPVPALVLFLNALKGFLGALDEAAARQTAYAEREAHGHRHPKSDCTCHTGRCACPLQETVNGPPYYDCR